MNYRVFRDSTGQVDAINRISDGATVPLNDPDHPLTQEFLDWAAAHPEFDYSNHNHDEANLIAAQRLICSQISELRTIKEEAGFTWNGYPVQSDPRSREKILGSFLGAQTGVRTDGEVWRMENNVDVPISNAEFIDLATALFDFIRQISYKSFEHKNAVNAMTSIEDVLAYNYHAGW